VIALKVFDPALCCSTGVCGPEVDESLVQFAVDLKWLTGQGVGVRRFNLAQEPGEFALNPAVHEALMAQGVGCLPILLVNEVIVARGGYPDRSELARLTGLVRMNTSPVLPALPITAIASPGCAPGSDCC
jgi:hypothetical protein